MSNILSERDLRIINTEQAKTIGMLGRELAILRKQVLVLQNALSGQTLEAEKSYRQLKPSLDKLSEPILTTIVGLVRRFRRPVNYEEIIRGFRAHHSFQVKTETITRQVRKLRENGSLHSPAQGFFVPIPVKEPQP